MIRFGVALARRIGGHDLPGMAAEMAYSFLFALFPLLLMTAATLGLVGAVFGRHDLLLEVATRISPFVPAPVAELVEAAILDLVTERAGAIALVGLVLALWGAANGTGALMKGVDRAYGLPMAAHSWRRHGLRAAATVLVPPLALALVVISVVAQAVTRWLGALTGTDDLVSAIRGASALPLTFAVVFAALTLVYWALPSTPQRYRRVLPGSLVAAIAWTTITQTFGMYVAGAVRDGAAYGVFGAAIAFLLWLYLVSLAVLVGAAVNALLLPDGRRSWSG